MPTLTIVVKDPPSAWSDYDSIALRLPTASGSVEGRALENGDLEFTVPFEIRPDRAGVVQAWGPLINRQGDGRRFIYLAWYGRRGALEEMFRRLKVYTELIPGFPEIGEEVKLQIAGKDAKGTPACATARSAI